MVRKSMKNNVLLVDDDASIRFVISKSLSRAGYKVQATDNVQTLLKWINNGEGEIIISDVHLGSDEIFNFLPEIKTARPDLPVVIISANTSVMTAMKSSQHKVFEYLPKPFDLKQIEKTIVRALGESQRQPIVGRTAEQSKLIGKSSIMQPVFKALANYIVGDIPVHIYGGPGTGKSLVARVLHEEAAGEAKFLVEFEEGQAHEAYLEGAHGKSMLVERIDELTADAQSILLRLLEKNEQNKRGDRFRLISVSQYSYAQIIENSLLRPDLAVYLSGGQIGLPDLSQRREDIGALAQYFWTRCSNNNKWQLSAPAIAMLDTYAWPGNVRELDNFMRKAHGAHPNSQLSPEIIENLLARDVMGTSTANSQIDNSDEIRRACHAVLQSADSGVDTCDTPHQMAIAWVEKPLIEEALRLTDGNNQRAAALLGIHRNTLRTKIKSLKIGKS